MLLQCVLQSAFAYIHLVLALCWAKSMRMLALRLAVGLRAGVTQPANSARSIGNKCQGQYSHMRNGMEPRMLPRHG